MAFGTGYDGDYGGIETDRPMGRLEKDAIFLEEWKAYISIWSDVMNRGG